MKCRRRLRLEHALDGASSYYMPLIGYRQFIVEISKGDLRLAYDKYLGFMRVTAGLPQALAFFKRPKLWLVYVCF